MYICLKYDVRLLCAQFLCWWWARVTSSLRTYNAMENWDLISSFVQLKSYGYLWVKHKCSVRFYISQGNRSDCCACPTATEHAYGKRTSYQNRKMLLRVSQDFHFICRGTYEQSWLCLTHPFWINFTKWMMEHLHIYSIKLLIFTLVCRHSTYIHVRSMINILSYGVFYRV